MDRSRNLFADLLAKTTAGRAGGGLNGSGKTTNNGGKLAVSSRLQAKNVVIAAGDTFRAAAVEQWQVWGGTRRCACADAAQGSDPASLAF